MATEDSINVTVYGKGGKGGHGACWHLFLLPIRPASPEPRLPWIEANCAQVQVTSSLRPIQYAYYRC